MTKSTKILILIMSIILIIFGILIFTDGNVCADDSDSKQIAEYEYQINELRKKKETCFDWLTLQETQDAWNWFTQPCVMFDEEIMGLRVKANELKSKSYDKLGL